MAGHMQHGPYPLNHLISDLWWIACFALVLVFAVRMHARGRMLFLVGSIFLIISPYFLWGFIPIELPLLGAMNVYAIGFLIRPSKFQPKIQQGATPVGGPSAQFRNPGVMEGPPSVT